MCFSATASFIGGGILTALGVATYKKVNKSSQFVYASVPFFFAIQQITEGFFWLSATHPEFASLEIPMTYFYLFLARVLWPGSIAIAMLLLETDETRKKILQALAIMGVSLAAYSLYCLFTANVHGYVDGYHIRYDRIMPKNVADILIFPYMITTLLPFFVSSIRKNHLIGVFMTIALQITFIFFHFYLTSVWCFFAAILSVFFYRVIWDMSKEEGDFENMVEERVRSEEQNPRMKIKDNY